MEQFIGCDAHKKFSVFVAVNEKGQAGEALRVNHERPAVSGVSRAAAPRFVHRSRSQCALQLVGG